MMVCALKELALEGKRNERELREVIRAAAALLEESKRPYTGGVSFGELRDAWLALPAVQSAIALEAADKGAL